MAGRQSPARRLCALELTVVLLLWLIACSSGSPAPHPQDAPATLQPPAFQLSIDEAAVANGRVTARLGVTGAEELYQLSCRIAYDPAALRPLTSRQAGLVTTDATFFTTLKAAGYVPVAFTYHEGAPLPAPDGILAELEFEILDPLATPQLSLVTDSDYLIARDNTGADLEIGLGVAQ